jgi:hypothetical protein
MKLTTMTQATPAGEVQVHGSGALIRWLLANDLVDECNALKHVT